MEFNDLKHKVQKGELYGGYLFTGPESGDKLEMITLLKQKFFAGDEEVVQTFYCDNEFSPAEFIEAVESKALFSSKKMILLKNIEDASAKVSAALTKVLIPQTISGDKAVSLQNESKFRDYYELKNDSFILKKIKEADKKILSELFFSKKFFPMGNDLCLILINESGDSIPESVSRLFSSYTTVFFYEMFENKRSEWIRNEFKKHSLSADEKAVGLLLETVENNKASLEREIFNISISFQNAGVSSSQGKLVTREFIEDHLYHSKIETPFTLFSAMIQKDLERALLILAKLYSEDKEAILPGLIWSQRRVVRMLDLYENERFQKADIFKELFITRKKHQEEMSYIMQTFTFEHAVHSLRLMTDSEYYVRVMPPDLKLVKLQQLVIDFIHGNVCKSFLQGPLQCLQV